MISRLAGYSSRFSNFIHKDTNSGLTNLALLVLRMAVLIGMFILLDRYLLLVTQIPETAYFEPVIFIQVISRLSLVNIALLVIPLLMLSARGRLWRNWSKEMQSIRVLVGVVCLLLAWWFATYDYNLYFDQGHYVDRILIIGLALLVIWKPGFVLPFLLVLLPVLWQFNYPIGGYSITQVNLPVNLLKVFVVTFSAQVITGNNDQNDFWYMTICLIGAFYLAPGIGKIELGWMFYPHLDILVVSSYFVGWLGFLPLDQISLLATKLAPLNIILIGFTLVAECGVLIALWNRRTLQLWLCTWIALHIGILLASGILFWTWIVIDLTLLLLLFKSELLSLQIFTWRHFLVAPATMLIGIVIFRPTNLSWYDVPVSYTYSLEAQTNDGEWITLPTQFFGGV